MKFIEMTGKTLARIVADDDTAEIDLHAAKINDETIVRINEQGDIEVRRRGGWDVIGGLLGDFEHRIHAATGMDWA
jgi:hypothetical protein